MNGENKLEQEIERLKQSLEQLTVEVQQLKDEHKQPKKEYKFKFKIVEEIGGAIFIILVIIALLLFR